MFKLRFLFPIVALIAISDALPHTDEQLTQELEQAKQEQIKLARRIAKLERQAVALDAEQTSRETSGRNIEIIVGAIAVIRGNHRSEWIDESIAHAQNAENRYIATCRPSVGGCFLTQSQGRISNERTTKYRR